MAELSDDVRTLLDGKHLWHVATVNPDGSPQVTPMWVGLRDGRILLNSADGRVKVRNLRHDGRVALSVVSPDSVYANAAIQGQVVEIVDGEQADADIDSLAKKYLGANSYPFRQPGESRVSFWVEPTHVWYRPPR